MSIVYDYFGGLYINLTNRCPNACEFCIRNFTDSLGDADSLVLKEDPTVEEVKAELRQWDVNKYEEVVFCGYGEPTERLKELLELAKFIKATWGKPIRINTNGLADLIWGEETCPWLEGIVDMVSVSMNEADAEKYNNLCHPRFGLKSYEAIIKYISDVKKYVPYVATSVVGSAISRESLEACRAKAAQLDVSFRVR
ncbi:MAG: TatD family nuclease-associated radical SAM protein [Clostridia bacterium]|nr:TatD family nuclease-associated radical SAM protein [Clostridia bacterium]